MPATDDCVTFSCINNVPLVSRRLNHCSAITNQKVTFWPKETSIRYGDAISGKAIFTSGRLFYSFLVPESRCGDPTGDFSSTSCIIILRGAGHLVGGDSVTNCL